MHGGIFTKDARVALIVTCDDIDHQCATLVYGALLGVAYAWLLKRKRYDHHWLVPAASTAGDLRAVRNAIDAVVSCPPSPIILISKRSKIE